MSKKLLMTGFQILHTKPDTVTQIVQYPVKTCWIWISWGSLWVLWEVQHP